LGVQSGVSQVSIITVTASHTTSLGGEVLSVRADTVDQSQGMNWTLALGLAGGLVGFQVLDK
jgi:hypothetical protein